MPRVVQNLILFDNPSHTYLASESSRPDSALTLQSHHFIVVVDPDSED